MICRLEPRTSCGEKCGDQCRAAGWDAAANVTQADSLITRPLGISHAFAHTIALIVSLYSYFDMSTTTETSKRRIRVAIVGAGIGGLATANGLLNDPLQRFEVAIFERDNAQFIAERGGYQLRICGNGLDSLKNLVNEDTWAALVEELGSNETKAPSMADPMKLNCQWKLGDVKLYPQSRPILRTALRATLLKLPNDRGCVRFGATFDRFEVVEGKVKDQHQVLLHFKDPERYPSFCADVLLAADGSNSRINAQVGLQNKVKLQDLTLLQSQFVLSPQQQAKLPRTLVEAKSLVILGGERWTGFASIYRISDTETQLFWAGLLPSTTGDALLEGNASSDSVKLTARLKEYLINEAGCDPAGLPALIGDGEERIRTGKVTSSRKPTSDWRRGEQSLSRVILLGDSIHPMTPGRGMGANQTLIDSSELVDHMKSLDSTAPSSADLQKLTTAFDREMFDRAFKMVKASEDLTGLDLNSYNGLAKITLAKTVLHIAGAIASVLEWLGLRQASTFELSYSKRCK